MWGAKDKLLVKFPVMTLKATMKNEAILWVPEIQLPVCGQVSGGVPTPTNSAPDTSCVDHNLKVASDSTVWGERSTRLPSPTRTLQTPISSTGCYLHFWPLINWLRTKGSSYPFQLRMPITQPGCYMYFCPTSYKSEVSMTLSLGSTDLLWWLPELREKIYLPDYQFLTKNITQEEPEEEMCRARHILQRLYHIDTND